MTEWEKFRACAAARNLRVIAKMIEAMKAKDQASNNTEIRQKCDSCGRELVVTHANDVPTKLMAFYCPCGQSTKTSSAAEE
jgi:hypothetical protein